MRLVIDCQILQTPAYDRGMGKYTLSLLQAFVKQNTSYEVTLLLSSKLEKSRSRISNITKQLPNTETIFLDLPTDISSNLSEKYKAAQKTIDEFLAQTYPKEDLSFLITAPFFVGFPAVLPSIPDVKKYSIVYDLIPLKIWHLQRIFPDDIYFRHFEIFLQADHLFTISEAVRSDLIDLLGIPDARVTSIDGGPFSQVQPAQTNKLKSPYILMVSAPIIHKNNELAVQAFRFFNNGQGNKYRLYITSNFDEATQQKLKNQSSQVNFTGNISDAELARAYEDAAAVFFPSLAEGLGMPVLEAALYDVPVACSNIPVLSELSKNGFYQFDPLDIEQIAEALYQAVKRQHWPAHLEAYKILRQKYTWQRSAKLLAEGLSKSTKAPKKSMLEMELPNPVHNQPAGVLGELLYAGLNEDFDVGLQFQPSGQANQPSYLAHISSPEVAGLKIKLMNKHRKLKYLLNKTHAVEIEVGGQKITLIARQKIIDGALQLKGWEYFDNDSKPMSPANIVKRIKQELKS